MKYRLSNVNGLINNAETVEDVLHNVEILLDFYHGHTDYNNMYEVSDYLSIFDWFKETLTVHDLQVMRSFLRRSKKNGFNGYTCFKVGASCCASGMWSYKELSTDGYSPKGDYLYRSFQSIDNYWALQLNGIDYPSNEESYCSILDGREIDQIVKNVNSSLA